ncbi:MAG: serine hydrolase [Sphingomonadales bacterium]|nr:serine hydrolase [Sphingomonadales bacterium]
MPTRRLPLILPLLMLPALIGCGSGDKAPPPLSPAALAAVVADPGVPRETLAHAIDDLFADAGAGETRALLVLSQGRIVAERYGAGYNRDSRLLGWSMTKTIVGVMIGQLVADGRLRLNETAPVPAWQRSGDPRGEITLRQLLQMRSGLRHTESGSPAYSSDEVRMLFLDGRDDMAAYAEAQPLEAEPGRTFEYSSASTVILSDLAARALTDNPDPAFRRQAVQDYLRTRLLDPVGMRSAVVEFDAAGTLIGSSMMHATARDWAKFGEFLRNGGAVRGAQLVPRGWIDFMTTPSSRNPAYGAQLWLNRPAKEGYSELFPDRAPHSAFGCVGHLGQYVIVSPEQKLTLVRLGKTEGEKRGKLRQRLADIVALFPKRP